jgi:hypothetical protein
VHAGFVLNKIELSLCLQGPYQLRTGEEGKGEERRGGRRGERRKRES